MKRLLLISQLFVLVSCNRPMKGVLGIHTLSFSSYDAAVEDWGFQNSYIDESFPLSFDYKLSGFNTNYHISGIDYTDSFVMDGYLIPANRRILGTRDMYNKYFDGDRHFYLFFRIDANASILDTNFRWDLIAYSENNDLNFTENHLSNERIPFCESSLPTVSDYLYVLTNDNNQRILYIAYTKNCENEFTQSKTEIETIVMEA